MFVETGSHVKVTYHDNKTYTGYVRAITIQPEESGKPHALVFISQDKIYIEEEGDFGCAALWIEKINSIQLL